MPFALLIVGIVMVTAAVRNTTGQLTTAIKSDFTGQDNFLYWMISILVIGAIGYIPTFKPLSRVFLALVIVVLFLSNGGFFQKFNQQIFNSTGV